MLLLLLKWNIVCVYFRKECLYACCIEKGVYFSLRYKDQLCVVYSLFGFIKSLVSKDNGSDKYLRTHVGRTTEAR